MSDAHAAELSVVNKRALARILQHPLSHNLSWRETLDLFDVLGTVEHHHNGKVALSLGDSHETFEPGHNKSVGANDVLALRHLLTKAGWTPDAMPMDDLAGPTDDVLVLIDHAGARVYATAGQTGGKAEALHHLTHDVDRSQHDADRDETYPADHSLFHSVATALAGKGGIVIFGHGKGQSNEASHLMAYLSKHAPETKARVAGVLVADLRHNSLAEMTVLARNTLQAQGKAARARGQDAPEPKVPD